METKMQVAKLTKEMKLLKEYLRAFMSPVEGVNKALDVFYKITLPFT